MLEESGLFTQKQKRKRNKQTPKKKKITKKSKEIHLQNTELLSYCESQETISAAGYIKDFIITLVRDREVKYPSDGTEGIENIRTEVVGVICRGVGAGGCWAARGARGSDPSRRSRAGAPRCTHRHTQSRSHLTTHFLDFILLSQVRLW